MTIIDEYEEIINGDIPDKGYYNQGLIQTQNFVTSSYPGLTKGIAAFGRNDWTTADYVTDDAGATWTAGGPGAGYDLIKVCDVDDAKAVAITTAGAVKFTDDSGATWTAASTAPANITAAWDLHYITAAMVVICGENDTNEDIWFSTDGGDNWTECTTGSTANTYAISMFDATTGFAVDSSGAIWKTTNGAVDWTDTTYSINEATEVTCKIRAITSSTFILVSDSQVEYFSGSANTTVISTFTEGTSQTSSDIIRIENNFGDYYTWITASDEKGFVLWKTDVPSTLQIQVKALGIPFNQSTGFESTTQGKGTLCRYDFDDKALLICGNNVIDLGNL